MAWCLHNCLDLRANTHEAGVSRRWTTSQFQTRFASGSRGSPRHPRAPRSLLPLRRSSRCERSDGSVHHRHSLDGVHERQRSETLARAALAQGARSQAPRSNARKAKRARSFDCFILLPFGPTRTPPLMTAGHRTETFSRPRPVLPSKADVAIVAA
jgi:hypothetical protein